MAIGIRMLEWFVGVDGSDPTLFEESASERQRCPV